VVGVVNFPTKKHWRNPSKLTYIAQGLVDLTNNPFGVDSISLPALGCGLGGLKFDDVYEFIEFTLGNSSFKTVEIVLYQK
jgi:hypothetical protein